MDGGTRAPLVAADLLSDLMEVAKPKPPTRGSRFESSKIEVPPCVTPALLRRWADKPAGETIPGIPGF
jgi:hypothetical protein